MSFVGGAQSYGSNAGYRFAMTRGRSLQSVGNGVNYPNPFFDLAHTYLPPTFKSMFRWVRYYFLTNGIIYSTAYKASLYPITDSIIEHPEHEVQKKWSTYWHEHLRWRAFQVEVGLDRNVYGNAFVSIHYPFTKYLECTNCGFAEDAVRIENNWSFVSYEFRLKCPKCEHIGNAKVRIQNIKNASGIRMVRWNPEDIEISHNPINGESQYYYTIPNTLRNDITAGKKSIVATVPQAFIQAVKENKGIKFSDGQLFHMKRPNLADTDKGWGMPMLMPVLKDAFGMQVLRKANEVIQMEHIIPLRVVFPQAASGSTDPFTTVNLTDWRDHIGREIAHWRMDPNYIPILPLPIGQQTIGGDGKSLMLTPELQQAAEFLVIGMGYPKEFIWGGASWAGTNVSLRMVENMFIGDIIDHQALAKWAIREISAYMNWPIPTHRFKPFRMADDLQRKQLMLQVNQAQKLSDTSLMAELDYEQIEENKIMERETDARVAATKKQQLAMAEIQGESQLIMAKYQAKAQQVQQQAMQAPVAAGEPGGPEANSNNGQQMPAEVMPSEQTQGSGQTPMEVQSPVGTQGGGVDLNALAQMYANMYGGMPAPMQESAIANLRAQSPALASLVQQLMNPTPAAPIEAPPEKRAPRADHKK